MNIPDEYIPDGVDKKKWIWRSKWNVNPFKPWEQYDWQHARRMCELTKSELVDWAVITFGWKKTTASWIDKHELKQMWCYKNNIIL
jgi:hypothetical protein